MDRNVAERTAGQAEDSTPLFPTGEMDSLRTRWKEIQTAFVDEPRKAVVLLIDEGDALELRPAHAARNSRSTATTWRISSSVPMVMRSHSGR